MSNPATPTLAVPAVPPAEPAPRLAFRLTVVIAGVFSLMIWLAMILAQIEARPVDLLKPEQIQAAKEKLRLSPNDEALKTQVRELDLQLRRGYFRQLSLTTRGSYLLFVGVAVFLIAAKMVLTFDRQPPRPLPKPDPEKLVARGAQRARWMVAGLGATVVLAFLSLSLSIGTVLPTRLAEIEKLVGGAESGGSVVSATVDLPSPEEVQSNWPRFRGADGGGVSSQTNAPLTWDVAQGRGVIWKVAVPAPGFNSPIVWGSRVLLSGGDAVKRSVYCLDARTGQTLWERPVLNVPGSPAQVPEIPEQTGYVASTMATDGRRVYVIFANGDLAALTLEGNPVWSKHLGVPKNPYGHASSLATWQGRLLVQLDQGESEQRQSKLYAFDGASGQIVWQRQRPVSTSWATPIVITAAGKPQVVTLSVPFVIAYHANDGTELWRVEGMSGEVTPSPVFAGGLVLAPSPTDKLMAIRPDGQGDVSKTHVAWSSEENIPDITSPVGNGELVFTVTSGGLLTCHDAKDGKKVWEHDFETDFHASPSISGDRLYLFGTKGSAIVTEAGRQFKQLARTEMRDAFFASPAFVNHRIYLRGATNLYCLGEKEEKLASAREKP